MGFIFKDTPHQLLLLLLDRIKIASSMLLEALNGSFSAGSQAEIRRYLALNTRFPLSASFIAILIKNLNWTDWVNLTYAVHGQGIWLRVFMRVSLCRVLVISIDHALGVVYRRRDQRTVISAHTREHLRASARALTNLVSIFIDRCHHLFRLSHLSLLLLWIHALRPHFFLFFICQ